MKLIKSAYLALLAVLLSPMAANATVIEFVPPNDTIGHVYTTNSNDGWNPGRGIGFTVDSAETINGVGLFQDLTRIDLSFGLYEIDSSSGSFSRSATLRTGGSTVTTSGLEWVDYSIADLLLDPTKIYLLEIDLYYNIL